MPYDNTSFATAKAVRDALAVSDEIFRYCRFESAALDGGESDGVFLDCTFRDFDWYWGIFNLALFVGCKFERCTFRGTAFAACRLVECEFDSCRFLPDRVGGLCTGTDTKVYGCSSNNCDGFDELFPDRVP